MFCTTATQRSTLRTGFAISASVIFERDSSGTSFPMQHNRSNQAMERTAARADEHGPRRQAKEAGVDYVAAVNRAERGDRAGLTTLFRVTRHLDGHGSETHCIILRKLLEMHGDKHFSDALRTESADTRKRVLESLDFDFAAPWQKKFPLTYALGPHHTSLFTEPKET
jgi:hypothetical protein